MTAAQARPHHPAREDAGRIGAARGRRVLESLVVLSLAMVGWGACATTPSRPDVRVRESTAAEAKLVREALGPLLGALDDSSIDAAGCGVGLGIAVSPRINASIGRGRPGRCPQFGLVLTEGAMRRLPVGMLRAVLAHELGHLMLDHTGRNSQSQERAADEFAARLLKRLEPRHPDACLQLVYVFSVLAEPGSAGWFAAHPSPDRRAEATLALCNR